MTTAPDVLLDLDAARRESKYPDGFPLRKGGTTFVLPAELPLEVFDPLLSEELDLVGILKAALEEKGGDADESLGEVIVDVLMSRPTLPRQVIAAIQDCLRVLFDAETPGNFDAFAATRPSVNDYLRLVKGLLPLYGVSLGEAFGSPASSESDGATLKQTSPSTADSTPEVSGDAPEKPAS